MIKKLLTVVLLLIGTASYAQIPYFSNSAGKGKTYTYLSTKFKDNKVLDTYWTASHGLSEHMDIVADASRSTTGFGLRLGSKYLGGMALTEFGSEYSYSTAGIFANTPEWKDIKLISNSWFTYYNELSYEQWTYLQVKLKKLYLLVGCVTDFDKYSKLSTGFYYNFVGSADVYLLYSDKLTIGLDYKF